MSPETFVSFDDNIEVPGELIDIEILKQVSLKPDYVSSDIKDNNNNDDVEPCITTREE